MGVVIDKHRLKKIGLFAIALFAVIATVYSAVSYTTVDTKADLASPKDRVDVDDILVYNGKVVLNGLDNVHIGVFTNTKSMDPVFDTEANTIEIRPSSFDELEIGDIVSYHSNIADSIVIHRIIGFGEDKDGRYAILKGDNNSSQDPEKVRFSQIKGVVVAVVY